MLNPLLNTIVLTIVFSTIFRFEIKNFIIYFLAGYQLWNFFAQSTAQASQCLLKNGPLFKKIYIPKAIFVISTVLSNTVNLALALLPLFILLPILGKWFPLIIVVSARSNFYCGYVYHRDIINLVSYCSFLQ